MKEQLITECVEILKIPRVEKWYQENLEGKTQGETISSLLKGIAIEKISTHEALSIALIVGFQWEKKFPGVK